MAFELPELPFEKDALEPWTSAETLEYHHGKHHAGYVKKLNAAVEGTDHEGKSLEDIITATRGSDPGVFNNTAQHWNHSFFWKCLSGEKQVLPDDLSGLIERDFGSADAFMEEFGKKAASLFGSGWAWLVQDTDDKLRIGQYKDADTPLATSFKPLLTLDVWEHAYYIDHRNDRGAFIKGFWDHVNWKHVADQLG